MNTKLLIFGLAIMLSCKKAETKVEPIVQTQVNDTTPVVKTPKLFNMKGNYKEMACYLNSNYTPIPFNTYKGDTVKVFARIQQTFPPNYNLEVYIYLDGKLFDQVQNSNTFEKTYIIE